MFGILPFAMNTSILLFKATRYLAGNYVYALLRQRQGLKYGVPAMLLGIPYLWAAFWLAAQIEAGASAWLNILVLGLVFSGLRFILYGPYSLLLLAHARASEARAAHRARRDDQYEQEPAQESATTV